MNPYILNLQDIGVADVLAAGGKGANLGELSRIGGVRVPRGFCVTTAAYRRIMAETPALDELLDRLDRLTMADREEIEALSAELRRLIAGIAIPPDMEAEIRGYLARLGPHVAYAVRSSATAEDLPGASFAGQQDTYLNIRGAPAILAHIGKCWASLFTARAVTYRLQNGYDHRRVELAVVVQQMVFPQAAGILFTADPVTGNRQVLSIEAGFGLGEALVAGLVNPDSYKVRDGRVIDKQIAAKQLAIDAAGAGGTQVRELPPAEQHRQVLAEAQILELAQLGRTIEAHFGCPQDIEWCLADDEFCIVQSRPITTLYPIPQAGDRENRVYISVGHQQMMTDAMKPLGLSFFLLTTRAPMHSAGGRLFVDVTPLLAAPGSRTMLLEGIGKSDPLIKDALLIVVSRGDFIALQEEQQQDAGPGRRPVISSDGYAAQIEPDPALVAELIAASEASIAELQRTIQTQVGPGLFDFIRQDLPELQRILFDPQSTRVFMAAMDAAGWLNEHMADWLGEKNAADTLAQSVPNNVTAEMGLALLDVADVLRPWPQVVAYLAQAPGADFLAGLPALDGGEEAKAAIAAFLARYGMRGSGEIDITRTRWRENPAALIPLLLSNVKNFAPGAGRRKFAQGQQAAAAKEQELLERLRQLPGGEQKARETKRMIDLLRTFMGYREYPKYAMVSRTFVYKQALLREAGRLVGAGMLRAAEDIYYLTFDELHAVARTQTVDNGLIDRRKEEYKRNEKLTPPRVITSEGEIVSGAYRREQLPAGALAGLPVAAGVVEGRARVILNMAEADLEPGDILVTAFTDPSWTPLFVAIAGLVTEVGGLMTHGAVIAREYGLPAVVGVENATRRIEDRARIRVHGTDGYVEIL
jgi:pyruvate,water dikinase